MRGNNESQDVPVQEKIVDFFSPSEKKNTNRGQQSTASAITTNRRRGVSGPQSARRREGRSELSGWRRLSSRDATHHLFVRASEKGSSTRENHTREALGISIKCHEGREGGCEYETRRSRETIPRPAQTHYTHTHIHVGPGW